MQADTVLVMGPFPLPVHGFSVATKELANAIAAHRPVHRVNLASSAKSPMIAKLGNMLRAIYGIVWLFLFRFSGGRQVSLGCNGGAGLIFTYLLVLTCGLLGLRCTLHHHSYAYINSPAQLMHKVVRWSGPNSGIVHVFLANRMQSDFIARYGPVDSAILPNAYMIPVAPSRPPRAGAIVLGLLSNLSKAKGLEHFINLARALRTAGILFEARLAGPVDQKDSEVLTAALAEIPELSHVGPVYSEEKQDFFKSLDLFVFPTCYNNEAQPIVLYEALAHGVPVLSVDRGCIQDQVGTSLEVFPDIETFDREAAYLVACLAGSEKAWLVAAQEHAPERLAEDASQAKATIASIFGKPGKKEKS